MKRILAALLLFGLATTALQGRADDRKEIDTLFAKLNKAIAEKNPNAMLPLEAPDFVYHEGKVAMNGKQVARQMAQQDAMMGRTLKMTMKMVSCRIHGKSATTLTSYDYAGEVAAPAGQSHGASKPHVMSISGTNRSELRKTSAGWRFTSTESVSSEMKMDGKPITPPSMGGSRRAKR